MQQKAKQRIKHIKMLQQIFTHMHPPGFFFLPPIGRWLLYRQTHKHKVFAVYNDKQPQVQNLKWRHLFRGAGGFFSRHVLYTVLNFFFFYYIFGQCFYSNCPRTLCLNGAITCGSFQRTFQAFFPLRDNLQKAAFLSARQMRLAEVLERKGWEGLPARSCLGGVPSLNSLRGAPLLPLAMSAVWGIIKEQMRI